jgi:glycosyltransferase involved in cell wall biosynthesis
LLAWSQYALRQFRWQNRNFAGLKKLETKTEVLYPAVPLRRTAPKKPSSRLKLLFVGSDFMRKGGPALLRAHSRLRKQGVPVETTVVSSLRWKVDDYIGPPSAEYVRQETARLAQEGVVHYPGLPNADVLRLMEEADYFIFPTFHDTFGFAPLEALSCATPVLATDTCAQPEIVADGRCGYLLPFENDKKVGKWKWIYRNREPDYLGAYDAAVECLGEAIAERMTACWGSRGDYEAMSAAAIEQVRSRFDQEKARRRLEQLYELCRR